MVRLRIDRQAYPDALKLFIARQLRGDATPTERFAWSLLRNRRILGLKFRRQHALHGFIVDFSCPQLRLVLELDGAGHDHPVQPGYDCARTGCLLVRGYSVIRVRNSELSGERLEQLLEPFVRRRSFPLSR
jgi:very-short-patch-repair endonuclease